MAPDGPVCSTTALAMSSCPQTTFPWPLVALGGRWWMPFVDSAPCQALGGEGSGGAPSYAPATHCPGHMQGLRLGHSPAVALPGRVLASPHPSSPSTSCHHVPSQGTSSQGPGGDNSPVDTVSRLAGVRRAGAPPLKP